MANTAAAWPSHKASCKRRNYIIKFDLHPEHITSPPVSRTLSCPADAPFYTLHMALQVAFGWATTHSFDFAGVDPDFDPDAAGMDLLAMIQQRMRLDQNGGMPAASDPREYLLRVVDPVQTQGFGAVDRMPEGPRRHPGTVEKKSDKWKLWQLFDDAKYQGHKMVYTYDFGDNWEHFMTVTGRADVTEDFVCLDGTGHYVAEDVGSWRGWEELKKAYRARNRTKEQKEKINWFEKMASNRDPQGLAGDRVNDFDREKLNHDLAHMWEKFERMGQEAEEQERRFARMDRSTFATLGRR
ncbi:plasmid p 4b orf-3 family protein [Podospora aff. communis PSN243]|uniref:Plasmid p 4b orf-3 family protein n=1 Tax=Podospora aff. communis PSN243 TaxID=3040156 RepID=A0AAV9FX12_9PEZI|nr:plasmid p 4b orf-3 family protein [Podospora aff. communis PSN243]